MADLDLSELDTIVAPTDEQLNIVSSLAEQQLALARDLEQLEAEVRTKKNLYVKVSQVDLPDAMAAINMTMYKLSNGASIDIKKGVDASIKVEDKPIAYHWLRENGHGAIIKNEFKIPFMAGADEEAKEFEETLEGMHLDFNFSVGIHARTLQAWAKAQLEEGNEIPEAIKVYEYSVAKVIPPRG